MRVAFLSLILICMHPAQDVKVVTYSTGTLNTNTYEGLSFWIKDDKKAYIRYAHAKDSEDIDLAWLGPVVQEKEKGFKAGFPAPDTNYLSIIPAGLRLKVTDSRSRITRFFAWENEGTPSGDPAAICNICAQDEKEAMNLLKKYFLK